MPNKILSPLLVIDENFDKYEVYIAIQNWQLYYSINIIYQYIKSDKIVGMNYLKDLEKREAIPLLNLAITWLKRMGKIEESVKNVFNLKVNRYNYNEDIC